MLVIGESVRIKRELGCAEVGAVVVCGESRLTSVG